MMGPMWGQLREKEALGVTQAVVRVAVGGLGEMGTGEETQVWRSASPEAALSREVWGGGEGRAGSGPGEP